MPSDSALVKIGIEHHRAGRFDQAQQIYRQLLTADPHDVVELNLLGALCLNLQRFAESGAYLVEALRLNPEFAAARDNWGLLMMAQNRASEAIDSFRQSLALDPNNAQTQVNLARALSQSGRVDEAIEAYARILQLAPEAATAHAEVAALLFARDRTAEALGHFRRAAELQPGDFRARLVLADALAQSGEKSAAIAAYLDVLALDPSSVQACVNLSCLYLGQKLYSESERWARRAVELQGDSPAVYFNLGSALLNQGRFAEALEVLQTAASLELPPEESPASSKPWSAAAKQRRTLQSRNAEAQYRIAMVYQKQGDLDSTLTHYDRSIELVSNCAEVRAMPAEALLLAGRLAEGLREYEWRKVWRCYPPYVPPWNFQPGESLDGRTILLCAEQGLGDTLQFVRYAAALKERGARVLFACALRSARCSRARRASTNSSCPKLRTPKAIAACRY